MNTQIEEAGFIIMGPDPIGELLVRPIACEDMTAFRNYYLRNRTHLAPWEPLRSEEFFEEANLSAMLLSQIKDCQRGDARRFGIFQGSSLVGLVSYTNIVRGAFMACHLGYSTEAALQGQGLMQQALRLTTKHMFDCLGMHRIMANYMPGNMASARVLRKLGFEIEGYARSYLKIAGQWEDHVLTSLLAPDADTGFTGICPLQ